MCRRAVMRQLSELSMPLIIRQRDTTGFFSGGVNFFCKVKKVEEKEKV
jgi:hypothetical protein